MKTLIRITGIVIAAIGLYMLVPVLPSAGRGIIAGHYPVSITLFTLGWMVVQFAEVIAGLGVAQLKSWAYRLAVPVLGIDFIVRVVLLLRFWILGRQHPQPTPMPTSHVVVARVSLWPGYVVALLVFGCILLLLSKPVRQSFAAKTEGNNSLGLA